MNALKKSIGIGALALAFAGCDTRNKEPNLSEGYVKPPAIERMDRVISTQTKTLEGMIVDVQNSSISLQNYSGMGNDKTALGGNHTFEYVIIKDNAGKSHILIYPYSKGILKHGCKVAFRPLLLGYISAQSFIDAFVNTGKEGITGNIFSSLSNAMPLEAEGIITSGGIEYK